MPHHLSTISTSVWLLALLIIIEGLVFSNLELAPAAKNRQPEVLGVAVNNDKNIINPQNANVGADLVSAQKDVGADLVSAQKDVGADLVSAQKLVDNETSSDIQNSQDMNVRTDNKTGIGLKKETPLPSADLGTINSDTYDVKKYDVKKTEEQLKLEEINHILNQPENKINLKKYQPNQDMEIFNPIKELIKKNWEIYQSLTE